MNYKIVKYNSEYQSQWNDFVRTSGNATFLHNRAYMDYHSDRFRDFSLLIFKEYKLVALLPAHRVENIIFAHKGLTYGDVLFCADFRMAYKLEVFIALLNYMDDEKIEKIYIKSIPTFFTHEKDEENIYILHKLQANLVEIKPFFIVDNKLGYRLNSDRKKNLKKMQKLSFILSDDKNNLPDFWQIVEENLSFKHQTKPIHSLVEISRLMQTFSDQIKLFTLFLNDEMVTGALVFIVNDVLHFQYIHSSTNAKNRQGVDYLIWRILEQFKDNFQFISFGSSSKGNNNLDKGLTYWKESFGAHIRNQFIYEIDVNKRHLLKKVLQ